MKNRRNYYRILQVQPDAPAEVIRSSYHTLMHKLRNHPDLGGEHWNAAVINEAYRVLSDPQLRADYDRKLFSEYTRRPVAQKDSLKKPLNTLFCPFCKYPLSRVPGGSESCPRCRRPLKHSAGHPDNPGRRKMLRRQKSGRIKYYKQWPQKGITAELVDISPQGMCFRCKERLRPREVIKISNAQMLATAQVVNVRKRHALALTYDVGVKFLSVKFARQSGTFCSVSS